MYFNSRCHLISRDVKQTVSWEANLAAVWTESNYVGVISFTTDLASLPGSYSFSLLPRSIIPFSPLQVGKDPDAGALPGAV